LVGFYSRTSETVAYCVIATAEHSNMFFR